MNLLNLQKYLVTEIRNRPTLLEKALKEVEDFVLAYGTFKEVKKPKTIQDVQNSCVI